MPGAVAAVSSATGADAVGAAAGVVGVAVAGGAGGSGSLNSSIGRRASVKSTLFVFGMPLTAAVLLSAVCMYLPIRGAPETSGAANSWMGSPPPNRISVIAGFQTRIS